jgi:hypothetical protein
MRISAVKALGAIAIACSASSSFGQSLAPVVIPQGVGCPFTLSIQQLEPDERRVHPTGTGIVVTAGPFPSVQLMNADTGKSLTLSSKGANKRTGPTSEDGSYTETYTGHWVVVWYPTDQPAGIGPAAIEYAGRLVIVQNRITGASILVSQTGKEVRDLCAALV